MGTLDGEEGAIDTCPELVYLWWEGHIIQMELFTIATEEVRLAVGLSGGGSSWF